MCSSGSERTWAASPHSARKGTADIDASWPGGHDFSCHGSKFDLAGRVCKKVPAPTHLVVPPYHFASNSALVIGADLKA